MKVKVQKKKFATKKRRLIVKIHANKKYSEKSDVFSAGALLYYLVAGRVPFDGNSDEEIKTNV